MSSSERSTLMSEIFTVTQLVASIIGSRYRTTYCLSLERATISYRRPWYPAQRDSLITAQSMPFSRRARSISVLMIPARSGSQSANIFMSFGSMPLKLENKKCKSNTQRFSRVSFSGAALISGCLGCIGGGSSFLKAICNKPTVRATIKKATP